MTQAADTRRLDRPVDSRNDHVLGPDDGDLTLVEYGSYACPVLPRGERRGGEAARSLRRSPALRVPAAAADRQRPRARARPTSRSPPPTRRRSGVAHVELMTRSATLTDDDVTRSPRSCRLAADAASRRTRSRGAKPASTRTSASAQRERRARDADVLHQRPALRRHVGRSVARRGDAGLARASRAFGGRRLRELGAVDRRPAAADVDHRDRSSSIRRWAPRSPRSGRRRSASTLGGRTASGCRCGTGSTTAC